MIKTLGLGLLLIAGQSWAKDLSVQCENKDGDTISLEASLEKAKKPLAIESFTLNGSEVNHKDVSKLPVYNKGDFKIKLAFGKMFYSNINFNLESCDDSFEATGKAVYDKYVGGFAGSLSTDYDCDCSFE